MTATDERRLRVYPAPYSDNNLIGTPEQVAEFLLRFEEAGATHAVPLHIAADTLTEIQDQLQLFAEEVMPLVRRG